ncbi:SDR family NAD(P)-dependent oxidoreductase [Polymorphobacter sp. PAMC 29334]|uniref:SDR family oxidoreductase n=1 Tax=Polymorphobacter sp. PAMC 29334 TaxID=2862331 RepID=UPI001C74C658|nr:SDR family oxidoreductase [Polymorphobacter sp. PAMC 29334]QYE34413.1 SDR family NAD(P)-dependent oxidoreductase [Polymorphobacter sp. PAMC 29334]
MPAVRLKPVSDQVIVVTGASSGIGLATCEAAAQAGAKVVMTARNREALADAQARLTASGAMVEIVVADIADPDATDRIAAAAIARFGRIDTWVNNAAAAPVGRVVDTPIDDQRRVFDVGYWGTVRGSVTALAHLKDHGGAIINVGSIESDRAVILQATYSAMKHAVKGFTDAFRTEVEADGLPVSVTLIRPAAIHTPFPEHARNFTGHPITLPPVIYDPRLVARAIVFAAANPRRGLSIGGTGVLGTALAQHFPRLTDLMLERFGEALQTFDKAPPADRADNLWEPRTDAVDSRQDAYVRTHSVWLEAQLRPWLAVGLTGAAAVAGLAVARIAGRKRSVGN